MIQVNMGVMGKEGSSFRVEKPQVEKQSFWC